ncbi:MAG TPA: hypothetical protein VN688_31395 [Gemmataceae bacterium]|nr:hypothetical protein [Gemmataceae bacterium]
MKTSIWMAGVMAALLANVSISSAQSNRYLLMEGTGEFGWSISRPSKINGEAEGRALALDAVNGKIEGMANIKAFEQFSKTQVVNTLSNKFENIGDLVKNTTTFSRDEKKADAFKGNKRGLVVTVQEMGFKPGTFSNSSDYNKLTGVRKSKASGILLYKFRVYAPDGYSPKGGKAKVVAIKYTIKNDSNRTVRFRMEPSGKSYTLDAGKTFSGTSNEVNGKAPMITVTNSGRTYKLTAGNHKFWWMSKRQRVGFDRETD